ncbi:MAG: ATP-dependent DNA ligase [Candidatus Nanopelagicales bacterium]
MHLPVMPPVKPMLAKSVSGVPDPATTPGGLLFEPKWDGFRCIVFRDGDEVELGSRNERPLTRYFPEVVAAAQHELPDRCVVDGEIILPRGDVLDFEALQQRIHPAASRVNMLAETTPAAFVAFDLLALADESLMERGFGVRRAELERVLADAAGSVFLTPATADIEVAQRWFEQFEGAGLDGIVAKPVRAAYAPDQRVMFKVKHERTADCVVAGFRWHKSGDIVGSLLLGLYDDEGRLQHVGVCGAFPMARRAELVEELAPYRAEGDADHPWGQWAAGITASGEKERLPGAVSRWNAKKDLTFVPLRPELVVEVAYDHMEGSRFRHTAQWRRWRPDRDPRSCTYEQLERPVSYDLATVLAGGA